MVKDRYLVSDDRGRTIEFRNHKRVFAQAFAVVEYLSTQRVTDPHRSRRCSAAELFRKAWKHKRPGSAAHTVVPPQVTYARQFLSALGWTIDRPRHEGYMLMKCDDPLPPMSDANRGEAKE